MCPKMPRRLAGLTMLEVLIASLILVAIVAMSSWLVWQASDNVATAEAALKLENQAREVLELFTQELRQSKMTTIRKVDRNSISVSPTAFYPPGNPPVPGNNALTTPNPPVSTPLAYQPFDAIRFRLPGPSMDLTKKNANFNASSSNFDMKKFSTNQDSAWTYEVMYWWEIDNSNLKSEGNPGTGPNGFAPNGIDDNGNGLIDEGVIKKIESWYDTAGVLIRRTQSVVARDVKYDNVAGIGCLKFSVPNQDAVGQPYAPGAEKSIQVSLTLQKRDPRYPKDSKRVIEKTVSTTIEVRN